MSSSENSTFRNWLLYGLLAVLLGVAVWLASHVPTADWYATYDPAVRGIFKGQSPYEQPLYVNPPWAVVLLAPLALFPPYLARGLILVASALAIFYTSWRLRAPRLAVIALFLSPTALGSLLAGNLDALVQLGLFLPPAWGLLILMIKPQIGFGVALYYLTEAWRNNKFVGILRMFAPLIIACTMAAIVFPVWVERIIGKPANVWNRSLFPYGLPIGIFFMYLAITRRNVFFSLAAAPFFAPYLTFYTYLMVQIALLHGDVEKVIRRDVLQIIMCVFLWVIMLVFRL